MWFYYTHEDEDVSPVNLSKTQTNHPCSLLALSVLYLGACLKNSLVDRTLLSSVRAISSSAGEISFKHWFACAKLHPFQSYL